MSELVLYIAQSLDGYIARKNGSLDWLHDFDDVSTAQRYEDFIVSVGVIIMGYSTYRKLIEELATDQWPYYDKQVYVFSHHKHDNPFGVVFVNDSLNEFILNLKITVKDTIWLVGGSEIIQQCMQDYLIDRYIITLIPTLLGEGIPLFKKPNKTTELKQLSVTILNKCVECEYINV
jgi:dihydrofolate reductase